MKILFVNHIEKQCGVYQYGKRVCDILKKDERYATIYIETNNQDIFFKNIELYNPNVIVYNWHPTTLNWLTKEITNNLKNKKQLIIFHESTFPNLHYDGLLMSDMSENKDEKKFSLPRPIFETNLIKTKNDKLTFGSFGFGFDNKGFEKICSIVQENFNEAIINLHITNAFFGDKNSVISKKVIENCEKIVQKQNINLNITTQFIDDSEILSFLNNNDVNMFLYDNLIGRGLSSVIDYATSIDTPLVINNSHMFRHLLNDKPKISIDNNNILSILDLGLEPIHHFRNKWSNQNLRNKFYEILSEIC
jgi:hypothetical protein